MPSQKDEMRDADDSDVAVTAQTFLRALDKHGRDVFLADTSYGLALAQENFIVSSGCIEWFWSG